MSSVIDGGTDTTLRTLAIVAGVFLVLVGLGTVSGMPWQTNNSVVMTLLQAVGVIGTIAIGAGLVWLARYEE